MKKRVYLKKSRRTKFTSGILMFMLVLGSLFASVLPVRADPLATISAANITMDTNSYADLGVYAHDIPSPGLAGCVLDLNYDPWKIQIVGISGSESFALLTPEFGVNDPNPSPISDKVTVAAADTSGQQGTFKLFELKIKALETLTDVSPFTVIVKDFAGPDLLDLSPTLQVTLISEQVSKVSTPYVMVNGLQYKYDGTPTPLSMLQGASVTLGSSTGSDVTFYYTTDGSTPSIESDIYHPTSGITNLPLGITTLKVLGTKNTLADSVIATFIVTVSQNPTPNEYTLSGNVGLSAMSGKDVAGLGKIYLNEMEKGSIDALGNYSITGVSAGTYFFEIKANGYLRAYKNLTISGDTQMTNVILKAGDVVVNVDGAVNIDDYTAVVAAYGTSVSDVKWNPLCDFDKNGVINLDDYNALVLNYGKSETIIP